MSEMIQPRVLKGFRDFLPQNEIARNELIEKITNVYRSFGFVPIDTPVLEYTEILLRKSNGETEKQVFRFTDNGGRDVAMRFDLTVPFARFTAEHKNELYFPFKRYHVAKVWRGEKPQAGRYREFIQCDVDIVGSDAASSDFEILCVMKAAFSAIDIDDITIHVNHRGIFNRFLVLLNLLEKSEDILRVVDKIAKIGVENVKAELCQYTTEENAVKILDYVTQRGDFLDVLEKIESFAGGRDSDSDRLREIYEMLKAVGIEKNYVLDPSITRGLDYYTGIVYETFLNDVPSIGSVCSGGRYDNLAGLYMKEKVPGVGMSIGLDRLVAALEQRGSLQAKGSYLDAEIYCQNESHLLYYQKVAFALRSMGVNVEVFPSAKKMAQQYALTTAKSVPWGILCSDEDVKNGTLTLKNLKTRETTESLSVDSCAKIILEEKQHG